MNSHSSEKRSDPKDLEKAVSPILVVNNSKLKPFIELFENYPENIMLQNLGTLLGFFKIRDKSEDSAYIVNFLSSVIKKEYYINHKRPVAESFDSALHKVNLALAEVAKNGNIRWIGQLDAAICVLEKNIMHFTVCGAAKILLLRNQMLSDISKDLNPEEAEPNPIKTFSNVSSGYLEKGDKIIITSSELFNIFSLNELKKGALRFDQEKFVQFLKTAMVNELDAASTIIIDLNENRQKKEAKKAKAKEAEQALNPFDGKTFEKPVLSPKDIAPLPENGDEAEYTDEKTGHIYVQGETGEPKENSFWSDAATSFAESFADFSYWLKNRMRKMRLASKQFAFWLKEKVILGKIALVRKIKERRQKKALAEENGRPIEKVVISEEIIEEETEAETIVQENVAVEITRTPKEPIKILVWLKSSAEKIRSSKLPGKFFSALKKGLAKTLPAFSRIKKSFLRLNYHQRLYAILTLIIIVVAPILISKLSAPEEAPVQEEQVPQVSQRDILLQDKNIREVSAEPSPVSLSGTKKTIFLNDQVFALSPSEISFAGENGTVEKFPLPADFGQFTLAAPMEDLNLVFILSDAGRLISFSPIAKKFQENTLGLPESRKIEGAGTYLTYLYLADSENRQIYRYPRATGGFGEKSDWLKESVDLSGMADMAIEENIFIAQNDKILKFFQGTKQEFNADSTIVPLSINKLFTGRELANLYALDAQNGRVIRFTKDGLLLNQYYSEKLIGATDFAVDEKNSKVYFVNSEGLSSFSM